LTYQAKIKTQAQHHQETATAKCIRARTISPNYQAHVNFSMVASI
jgi:hypothetical protein